MQRHKSDQNVIGLGRDRKRDISCKHSITIVEAEKATRAYCLCLKRRPNFEQEIEVRETSKEVRRDFTPFKRNLPLFIPTERYPLDGAVENAMT